MHVASLPQGVLFVVLNHLRSVEAPRTLIVWASLSIWASLCLPATIVHTCFDNTYHNASAEVKWSEAKL